MHISTKVGFGALVTVGAVAAVYHTAAKRRSLATLPSPASKPLSPVSTRGNKDQNLVDKQLLDTTKGSALETEQPRCDGDGHETQWQRFAEKLAATRSSVVSSIPSIGVTNVLPEWSLGLPDWISRLQKELNMEPDSLAHTIWTEARDPRLNPEVRWDASVRLSPDLCEEEKQFLQRRRKFSQVALARYLGIPEEEVHEDDVPIISVVGSGGGLRAMVASTGYYEALQETGLFDCCTYMAGVSGSCWLQSIYFSSLGQQSFKTVSEHLKSRINIHIAYPPKALELVDNPPTNKYLLRGVVEKLKLGYSRFGLVDVYGLLLGARLLVHSDGTSLDENDLKLSQQQRFIGAGQQPMPIYTAVRHEIPGIGAENEMGNTVDEKIRKEAELRSEEEKGSWFQWFEVTPYEVYCEDLEAGIPTWALGRKFENGSNTEKSVPELRQPLLLGIFGSAFCATLSHYYNEIRPLITSINALGKFDAMMLQLNGSLSKVHPIDPATVPNFVKGLKERLPTTCPKSLHDSETIQLMDAGMSNNLACYPLMRKGRDVDIVIALDSSADIQTANWLAYTEGYAKQRKIQGWPVSIGWPRSGVDKNVAQLSEAQAESPNRAREKLGDAKEKFAKSLGTSTPTDSTGQNGASKRMPLGPLTIWVGSKEIKDTDDEPPPSKAVEDDWELARPDAGIVVAYLPLISNPKVPDVDPEGSAYLSTWNFEWTPEQVDKTIALARANYNEGAMRMKRMVRAVYERKRQRRREREAVALDCTGAEEARRELIEESEHDERRRTYDHFS